MSDRKIVRAGNWFLTELANALFKLSGASIALNGTIATVTLASHLLATGDQTTFSGTTGVTALNNATWGPVTVTGSGTYTFPCSLTGSPGGTIVQEKLFFFPAGQWIVNLGANGQVEYNPDNSYGANFGISGGSGGQLNSGPDATWRILIPASTPGNFDTDGFAVRFRENGTTATSNFSQVA